MKLNTAKSDHLQRKQLLQVLSGEADPQLSQYTDEHIESCPDCLARLESLAAEPVLWKHVTTLMDNDRLGETIALTSGAAGDESGILQDNSESWLANHNETDGFPIESLLDDPSHPEMLGRLGHYDIEREIGRGGMGVVLKAFDIELNRPVAIKIMSPVLAGRGAARQRFAREARAAAAILHPNVIAIHGVSVADRTPYLVMPYITGPSLEQIVEQNGPMAEKDIVSFAMQIASGLAAAHSQGVIHRDIKPANILIENGVGRVVITDFGLARAESDVSMTQTGWFAGTPAFMSPEQASGQDVDARSDLFSLGSVLYYMATGRLPFRAEQPMAILERIRNEHPQSARLVNSDISLTLANLIDHLLAKKPNERIQSAAELQQVLEQYLAHLHQPAHVKKPRVVAPRRSGNTNLLQKLVWSLAGAVVLAAGVWAWTWFKGEPDSFASNGNSGVIVADPQNKQRAFVISVDGQELLDVDAILEHHNLIANQYELAPLESLEQEFTVAHEAADYAIQYFSASPGQRVWGDPQLDNQLRELESAVHRLEQALQDEN